VFEEVIRGAVTELRMSAGLLGRPLYWVSAFSVGGVLIDSGPWRTRRELAAWARGRPPLLVLNTHHHEDHVGGDSALASLGASLLAPEASLARLANPPRIQPFRMLAWGRPAPLEAQPLAPRVCVAGLSFEAIPTPGHSDDQVAFLVPEQGWLFTGDAFVHERIRYAQADENAAESLRSLRSLLAYDFEDVFCGHAGHIPRGKEAIRRKVAHLEEVQAKARLLQNEGLDDLAIARRIFGRLGNWHWITAGWFSEVNLVRQLRLGADGS
jgi:glyoxylase-like metal-dependent hydrolase (beta-lactamase superfamily II)